MPRPLVPRRLCRSRPAAHLGAEGQEGRLRTGPDAQRTHRARHPGRLAQDLLEAQEPLVDALQQPDAIAQFFGRRHRLPRRLRQHLHHHRLLGLRQPAPGRRPQAVGVLKKGDRVYVWGRRPGN
ncbi:hypothetical protein ACRAWF_13545 [Streptomyces sp. L7]